MRILPSVRPIMVGAAVQWGKWDCIGPWSIPIARRLDSPEKSSPWCPWLTIPYYSRTNSISSYPSTLRLQSIPIPVPVPVPVAQAALGCRIVGRRPGLVKVRGSPSPSARLPPSLHRVGPDTKEDTSWQCAHRVPSAERRVPAAHDLLPLLARKLPCGMPPATSTQHYSLERPVHPDTSMASHTNAECFFKQPNQHWNRKSRCPGTPGKDLPARVAHHALLVWHPYLNLEPSL